MLENDICNRHQLVGKMMQNIDLTTIFEIAAILFGFITLIILLVRDHRERNEQNSDVSYQSANQVIGLQRSVDELNRRIELLSRKSVQEKAQTFEIFHDIQNRVAAMNDVMSNKNRRGSWGEYQLEFLLNVYLGQSSTIFETQYPLANGCIVDAALHLPNTEKILPLDSKFPLDSYTKIQQANNMGDRELERRMANHFNSDVKRHIKDIKSKYVSASEAIGQAVMFVPSEAIYTYICSGSQDLLDFALSNQVLICSPTTLIGVVSAIVNATKDFEQVKNMDEIIRILSNISQDAQRLEERANKLGMRERQLAEEIENVAISSRKIASNIDRLTH